MLPTRLVVEPDFFARAAEMRAEFEARVRPDRVGSAQRLVWDYWYIEGQYAYLRCLARNFFSPGLYRAFLAALRDWGSRQFGCANCTELWLSYYLDGCRQELHADIGQGPWAVVYSLTRWNERRFGGGETLLLGERVLDYWRHFQPAQGLETGGLFECVPARFNQLIAFDGRIPHGVQPVEGTRDPLDSRVVLHGWFQMPDPAASGALRLVDAEPVATRLCAAWNDRRGDLGRMHGVLTVRLHISASGSLDRISPLANTLVSLEGRAGAAGEAVALALDVCQTARFVDCPGPGTLLLPFIAADR